MELHEKWRAINLLNALTSAVHNHGQPRLIPPNSSLKRDDSGNKYQNILLQAISTLLVRNGEVMATIGTTANTINEPGNPGLANLHASCQWPALHEVEWKEGVPNQAMDSLFHVIAVSNPERRKKLKPEDRPGDCLVTLGSSHFTIVDFHKWDSLFAIS